MNCWKFKECKVHNDCPAYPSRGESCFAVEGTLCRGEVQGGYVDKIAQCRECDFYAKTIKGE